MLYDKTRNNIRGLGDGCSAPHPQGLGPKKPETLRTQHRPLLGVEMLALAGSLEQHHCLPLHTRTACPTATAGSFFVNSQELKRKTTARLILPNNPEHKPRHTFSHVCSRPRTFSLAGLNKENPYGHQECTILGTLLKLM